jgi:nucleoside-diphosphate-sugar epimerase
MKVLLAGVASFVVGASMRVSNAKARAELGWHPSFPTYHDGIRAMASPRQPVAEAEGS